jgi:hypothetical protein
VVLEVALLRVVFGLDLGDALLRLGLEGLGLGLLRGLRVLERLLVLLLAFLVFLLQFLLALLVCLVECLLLGLVFLVQLLLIYLNQY